MRRRTPFLPLPVPALLLIALAVVAAPVRAQAPVVPSTTFGVGYAANAPELLAGGGAYVVLPAFGGIGLYVDAKFDTSDRADDDSFDASLTARQVDDEIGDEYRDADSSWRSFNAAIIRPVTPSMMLYAGVGYAEETAYRRYYDDTEERGLAGYYWVASPEDDRSTLNVLGGMFLRITRRFNAQFGAETAPAGGTVGLSVVLP